VLHTRVEAHDWFAIGQDDRQLQLCVPLVQTTGESLRLSQAIAGQGVTTHMNNDYQTPETTPGSFMATSGQNTRPPAGRSTGRRWADLNVP